MYIFIYIQNYAYVEFLKENQTNGTKLILKNIIQENFPELQNINADIKRACCGGTGWLSR